MGAIELPGDMQLFNTKQVAERLGVSSRSVLRWIQSGRLKGQKLGPRQYRVTRDDLDNFLERTRLEAEGKSAE